MGQDKNDRNWLAKPAVGHPLSDVESARALIDSLATGDSVTVLHKITAWIDEINTIPDIPLQHQFDVLDLFDRFAKNHQLNLVPEYFDTPRMRKLSESQLWTTSFAFWQSLGDGYLRCLGRFQAADAGAKEFRAQLPLVVCRILRSLALQLKWTLLRYASVEERIWRDLGRAYLFAASWGFSSKRSSVYPGAHGETTAQEELLKALMLAVSSLDSLTPVEQHIAERFIAHFGNRFALHTTPGPGCTYSFDLSMYVPPARSGKYSDPAPLLRFFGPGIAPEGLREITTHMLEHGSLPAEVNLRGNFDLKQVGKVLDHLARCWADTPQTRRRRRRDAVTRLTVVPGLVASVRWLECLFETGDAEGTTPPDSESWVVFDMSDDGCGAVVPAQPGDWLTIGALVGVRGETAAVCRMGVLRRITHDTYGQQRIGMELIGTAAIPVTLFPATARNVADLAQTGESAILLSREPDAEGEIELLLRPGSFSHVKQLQMRFRDRVYRLDLARAIDRSKEYNRSAFRLVETA